MRAGKGAEGRINAAAGAQPKSGHMKPASGSGSKVGNETKAATRAAGLGAGDSVVGTTSLGAACGELKSQHPEAYSSMGPHQSGSSHIRHMPLGGLKPARG